MNRWLKLCVFGVVGILMVYFFGVIVFWNRFSCQTYVRGSSVALQSSDELTLDLLYETQQMSFVLVKHDGTKERVLFKDLGIYRESDNAFVGVELPSWLWFIDVFRKDVYELSDGLFYDREQLYANICGLDIVTGGIHGSVGNCRVVLNDGEFEVVYTDDDKYIDVDRLLDVFCEHIQKKNFVIDLEAEGCYHVYDAKLVDASEVLSDMQDLEQLRQLELTIYMDSNVCEVVPAGVLGSVVGRNTSGQVVLYPQVLASYVAVLADKYDTVGNDRLFVTHDGETVTLHSQEKDTFRGYELNQEALLLSLLNAISLGDSASVFAPWYSVGHDLSGDVLDIGNTYVEIDIERQQLFYYESGKLVVSTDVVTGLDTDDRRTPTGVFYVMSLNTNYTMYYPNGSSVANYFIKLTGDGVGIHDSTNRNVYGSDIWRTSGSHGCINTPYDVVEKLFERLQELDDYHVPVVIH